MFRSCTCLFRTLRPPIKESLRRSFKRQTVEERVETEKGDLEVSDLWKPVLFSTAFTGVTFAASSIWQYESYIRNHSFVYMKNLKEEFNRFSQVKRGHYRNEAQKWWHSLSETERLVLGIAFINTLVFCAWRVPSLAPVMHKYFACTATKKPYVPMFLSMFSHSTPIHLGLNMYVLYSFSQPAGIYLGKEQFLALYMCSGIFGSLGSIVNKTIIRSTASSVGASGAILGPIAATCLLYPDSQVQIIFLPFFTFTAGLALKALVAVDTIGLIARWRFLDHAAHLGGALFGVYYIKYGQYHFSSFKARVIKEWHTLRTGSKKP